MADWCFSSLLFFTTFALGILQTKGQYSCHCKKGCSGGVEYRRIKECTDGCQDGYFDRFCQTLNVAERKPASQISTYSEYLNRVGKLIKKRLTNTADKAVDGNANTFYSRNSCTHTLPNETSPYWTVDLLQDYDIYKLVIYQRSNFRERLTGFEVYVDEEFCYRWEPSDAPPFRIGLLCVQPIRGRRVTIQLPKRPDSAPQILTLCEVLVLVCNDYWYGERCDKRCHCRDGTETCNRATGHCNSGCASGYIGDDCQQLCPAGRWGEDCSRMCGNCRAGITCVAQTGSCSLFGCQSRWTGPRCTESATESEVMETVSVTTLETPGSVVRLGTVSTADTLDTAVTTETPDDSQREITNNNMSSGNVFAILFGILACVCIIVAAVLLYRKWKRSKASVFTDNHYDNLTRSTPSEHVYVGMGEVKHKQGCKTKDQGQVKVTDDGQYDYIDFELKENNSDNDDYLTPVDEKTKEYNVKKNTDKDVYTAPVVEISKEHSVKKNTDKDGYLTPVSDKGQSVTKQASSVKKLVNLYSKK